MRWTRVSWRGKIDIWISVLLRNQPEAVRMIIENQNVSRRFAARIGRHRRCDDSEEFLPRAREIAQNRTANVTNPNPFTRFSSPGTRSCTRVVVIIKPWSIHVPTVWPLVSRSLLRGCGIFYSPARGVCRSLFWSALRNTRADHFFTICDANIIASSIWN